MLCYARGLVRTQRGACARRAIITGGHKDDACACDVPASAGHAWYCNADCQRLHFKKAHKPYCKALQAFKTLQVRPHAAPCIGQCRTRARFAAAQPSWQPWQPCKPHRHGMLLQGTQPMHTLDAHGQELMAAAFVCMPCVQKDIPPSLWPPDHRALYLQRINCDQVLRPLLRRPLARLERRAIIGEAACTVCARTRSQLVQQAEAAGPTARTSGSTRSSSATSAAGGGASSDALASLRAAAAQAEPIAAAAKAYGGAGSGTAATHGSQPPGAASAPAVTLSNALSCCPACKWGWACAAHWQEYMLGAHRRVCAVYQCMNESQLLTHTYLATSSKLPSWWVQPQAPGGAPHPIHMRTARRPMRLAPAPASRLVAAVTAYRSGRHHRHHHAGR